jgi:hypothetical protein
MFLERPRIGVDNIYFDSILLVDDEPNHSKSLED